MLKKYDGEHFCLILGIGEAPCSQIFMKLGAQGEVTDIITCAEYLLDWSRGYEVLRTKIAVFLSQTASPLQQSCTTVLNCESQPLNLKY